MPARTQGRGEERGSAPPKAAPRGSCTPELFAANLARGHNGLHGCQTAYRVSCLLLVCSCEAHGLRISTPTHDAGGTGGSGGFLATGGTTSSGGAIGATGPQGVFVPTGRMTVAGEITRRRCCRAGWCSSPAEIEAITLSRARSYTTHGRDIHRYRQHDRGKEWHTATLFPTGRCSSPADEDGDAMSRARSCTTQRPGHSQQPAA